MRRGEKVVTQYKGTKASNVTEQKNEKEVGMEQNT